MFIVVYIKYELDSSMPTEHSTEFLRVKSIDPAFVIKSGSFLKERDMKKVYFCQELHLVSFSLAGIFMDLDAFYERRGFLKSIVVSSIDKAVSIVFSVDQQLINLDFEVNYVPV